MKDSINHNHRSSPRVIIMSLAKHMHDSGVGPLPRYPLHILTKRVTDYSPRKV